MGKRNVGKKLSPREEQIAILMMHGYTREAAASELGISFHTLRHTIRLMMLKYDAVNTTHLIFRLLDSGRLLIDSPLRTLRIAGPRIRRK